MKDIEFKIFLYIKKILKIYLSEYKYERLFSCNFFIYRDFLENLSFFDVSFGCDDKNNTGRHPALNRFLWLIRGAIF